RAALARSMPSSALAIAISRALTRPSRARRARRRSSSEPMSSRIANADIVGSLPPDHNICYSQPAFDATLLASQHQLRSVLAHPRTIVTTAPSGYQKQLQTPTNVGYTTNPTDGSQSRRMTGFVKVSDAGPARSGRPSTRGRRPKASEEGTRGKVVTAWPAMGI